MDGSQYSDLEKDSTETRMNDIELGLKDQEPEVEPEVPIILDEMMMVDKVKKSKKTPQSSDYSKFIIASGHTNNSDVFHQSQSQSGNHVHESQSPLSSDDVSPSVLTNQNLSTDLSQSDPLSNQTWSGMQNKKVTSSSSSSSSSSDTDGCSLRFVMLLNGDLLGVYCFRLFFPGQYGLFTGVFCMLGLSGLDRKTEISESPDVLC